MDIGSSFLLRLPAKDGKQGGVPLICRVAHCVPQKSSFIIGAEFIGRLATQRSAGDNAADLDRIQTLDSRLTPRKVVLPFSKGSAEL